MQHITAKPKDVHYSEKIPHMATAIVPPIVLAAVDDLFKSCELADIERFLSQKRLELHQRRKDLRTMLGGRYRDVIECNDVIASMHRTSSDFVLSVSNIEDQSENLREAAANYPLERLKVKETSCAPTFLLSAYDEALFLARTEQFRKALNVSFSIEDFEESESALKFVSSCCCETLTEKNSVCFLLEAAEVLEELRGRGILTLSFTECISRRKIQSVPNAIDHLANRVIEDLTVRSLVSLIGRDQSTDHSEDNIKLAENLISGSSYEDIDQYRSTVISSVNRWKDQNKDSLCVDDSFFFIRFDELILNRKREVLSQRYEEITTNFFQQVSMEKCKGLMSILSHPEIVEIIDPLLDKLFAQIGESNALISANQLSVVIALIEGRDPLDDILTRKIHLEKVDEPVNSNCQVSKNVLERFFHENDKCFFAYFSDSVSTLGTDAIEVVLGGINLWGCLEGSSRNDRSAKQLVKAWKNAKVRNNTFDKDVIGLITGSLKIDSAKDEAIAFVSAHSLLLQPFVESLNYTVNSFKAEFELPGVVLNKFPVIQINMPVRARKNNRQLPNLPPSYAGLISSLASIYY